MLRPHTGDTPLAGHPCTRCFTVCRQDVEEATYPELEGDEGRARLVVLVAEIGGTLVSIEWTS